MGEEEDEEEEEEEEGGMDGIQLPVPCSLRSKKSRLTLLLLLLVP